MSEKPKKKATRKKPPLPRRSGDAIAQPVKIKIPKMEVSTDTSRKRKRGYVPTETPIHGLTPSWDPSRGITMQEELFCVEFLRNNFNQTQAARAAGYGSPHVSGARNMKKPKVLARINELRRDVGAVLGISLVDVAKEMLKIALFDARKLFNDDGSLRKITELDDVTAASISGVEYEELRTRDGEHIGRGVKVKVVDKMKALDSLAGLLDDRSQKLELTHILAGAALADKLNYRYDDEDETGGA